MSNIIGHQLAIKYLEQASKQNNLAQAYLLTGPAGVGKSAVADHLIKLLNKDSNQADVLRVSVLVDKKEITIDQIRQAIDFLRLGSWGAGYRIAIIEPADCLNIESSNALLKTLEEPIGKTIIILITARPRSLLPTIISRCQLINLSPVPIEQIKDWLKKLAVPKAKIEELVHLAQGSPGRAYVAWQNETDWQKDIAVAKEFISVLAEKYLSGTASTRPVGSAINIESLTADEAQKVITIYLEIARDLLLYKYSSDVPIWFYSLRSDLDDISKNIDTDRIIKVIQLLQQTLKKLQANANIKLTFEWLFITLR
jgi:DNA polymerase III subunit delta'